MSHRRLPTSPAPTVVFWTSGTGIDGETRVEIDELDLILIDPLPSYVWYQDMVDFAEGISDRAIGRRLSASLQGKSAFRRFKNEVYGHHPELISAWQAMCDARARVRAVHWLVDEGLVDEEAAQRFTSDNPEPTLPRRPMDATGSTRPGCPVATVRHFAASRARPLEQDHPENAAERYLGT